MLNAKRAALRRLQHEIDALGREHFRCNSREESRLILAKIHDKQKALTKVKESL